MSLIKSVSDTISQLTGIYGCGCDQYEREDNEANLFARCLLMPSDLVKKQLAMRGGDMRNNETIMRLADDFGVEVSLMSMRLVEIATMGNEED